MPEMHLNNAAGSLARCLGRTRLPDMGHVAQGLFLPYAICLASPALTGGNDVTAGLRQNAPAVRAKA